MFPVSKNTFCLTTVPLFNPCSKWRTTPVVEEVFAEVLALVAAAGAVDAAEAVEGAAVPGVASPRTRK